ncbi:MAG: NADPH-dependent F420 reductase [Candidatus Nitrosocaldus sp.]
MKIGLVGGTGRMGEGLALRWCVKHDIVVGSRDASKAVAAAQEYMKEALAYYGKVEGSIDGDENSRLVGYSDVVVLCIPYDNIEPTLDSIAKSIRDKSIVICPIVPMSRSKDGFIYTPMHEHRDSAAMMVSSRLVNTRVVATLHTISDVKLRRFTEPIDTDVLVCADDRDAVAVASELLKEIKNLRPLYVGPLSLAYQIESVTPMLLNISRQNSIKNPSIKIT